MQYVFYFDQNSCSECGTCVVACKDWNGVNPGPVSWRKVYRHEKRETGSYPNLVIRPLVYSCNHCEEPACVQSCSAGAISKRSEDGIVIVNRNKCQSLKSCVDACPYNAVQIADSNQELPDNDKLTPHPAQKCTFCLDRWSKGDKPICVMSCPQRALDAGPLDEILRLYKDVVPATEAEGFPEDLYGSKHTKPNLYMTRRK